MSRLPRVCPVGVTQHVIQRGNNRQICFGRQEDYFTYVGWLKEFSIKFSIDIHAWVLMTNHVHLLCTPREVNAVSQMMQALGRQYVRYFNHYYKRTGTLWEGRFKSCLVEDEVYLLHLYRYIELNPLRAVMVAHPADYRWSSYQINALSKTSTLCTPHPLYIALGRDTVERKICYQSLFTTHIEEALLKDIRSAIQSGMALGKDRFKEELTLLTGRRLQTLTSGRKVGWRKN